MNVAHDFQLDIIYIIKTDDAVMCTARYSAAILNFNAALSSLWEAILLTSLVRNSEEKL